jgi:flagellar basal-body rod protein FlgG
MLRGMYTATSGLLTITRDINIRSNNMANVSTAGFKQDRLVTTTFAEALAVRQDIRTIGKKTEIGSVVRGKKALELKTDFSQGTIEPTFRTVDFAISGEGFFTIYNEEADTTYYTRNGQFAIDPDGYLMFGETGHFVVDDIGDTIEVGISDFIVTESGAIYTAEGDEIATLGIFVPDNPELLIKKDDEVFSVLDEDNAPEELEFTGKILQGYIERANTDVASQMAALIANSRSYQSLAQVIKTIDGALAKTVNDVGRV